LRLLLMGDCSTARDDVQRTLGLDPYRLLTLGG
jgi:hypothetical protein